MRYLMFAVLAAFAFGSIADTEVPHTFSDGTPAKAAEVNANFDAIVTALNSQGKDVQTVSIDCNNDGSALSQALDGRTLLGPPLSFSLSGVCLLPDGLVIARTISLEGVDANAAIQMGSESGSIFVSGSGAWLALSNLKMVGLRAYALGPGTISLNNVTYEGNVAHLAAMRGGSLSAFKVSVPAPLELEIDVVGGSVGTVIDPTGKVKFFAANNSALTCTGCNTADSVSINLDLNSTFCGTSDDVLVASSVTLTANSSMSVATLNGATPSVDGSSSLIVRGATSLFCG